MIHIKYTTRIIVGFLLLFAILSTSCSKNEDNAGSINPAITKPNIDFIALTSANQLLRYNATNPSQSLGGLITLSGLQANESIVAIDYRPATGQLYGLGIVGGTTARLYVLPITSSTSATTVPARLIGASFAISGGVAGFDFDASTDRLRIVNSLGANISVNPEDGTVVNEAAINGGTNPRVTGLAYSNNKAGATTTQLYGLDVANQKIYQQVPATGVITELGLTGLIALPTINMIYSGTYQTNIDNARKAAPGGFDIAPDGTALAILMVNSAPAIPKDGISVGIPASAVSAVNGTPTLFKINLETGKATDLGVFSIPSSTSATQIIGLATAPSPVAYAVELVNSTINNLLIFNPTKPDQLVSKEITGLQGGEVVYGIDFRPANGQLYALGSTSRLYTINAATAVATQVGLQFILTPLSGTAFGFDFNPKTDAIRVVSNFGQNMRITTSAAVTVDPVIDPVSNEMTATAFSSNTPGASAPLLYMIDSKTFCLYKQDPIADATNSSANFTKVGKLGLNVEAFNGFDIGGYSGTAYAILTVNGQARIYVVSLTTGLAVTPGVAFPSIVNGFTVGLGF